MTDTTIGKLITKDIKLIAFKREFKAREENVCIYRLTDFSFGYPEDTEYDNADHLVEGFMKAVASYSNQKVIA